MEHFMVPSAETFSGDADLIFQQDLAPAQTLKGTRTCFNDHDMRVLYWSANWPDLNTIKTCGVLSERKIRYTRPNNADDLKATI